MAYLYFPNIIEHHDQADEASQQVHPLAHCNPLFVNVVMVDARRVIQKLQGLVDVLDKAVQNHHCKEPHLPPGLVDFEIWLFRKGDFEGNEPEVEDGRKEDDVDQAEEFDQHQVRRYFGEVEGERDVVQNEHDSCRLG